jgi:hypothetical protein
MDYYQGVVLEFLRANRSTFVNTEFWVQLEDVKEPPKGTSWYIDILAANFRHNSVFVCEVTFSLTQHSLLRKLRVWSERWDEIKSAIRRDIGMAELWSIEPWLFVPLQGVDHLRQGLPAIFKNARITALENTAPWMHNNYNRKDDMIEQPDNA